MKAIVCLDEKHAMAFNNRRQSMDKAVRIKIAEIVGENPLFMLPYSYAQFENEAQNIIVCDDLSQVNEDSFVFFEITQPEPCRISSLYTFMWNRHYPSDMKLGFDIDASGFVCTKTEDFAGISHEKITLNIYTKERNR